MYLYPKGEGRHLGGMETGLDLTALTLFAFVSSITPGPNNLLLMRSGARFGFAPTGPHVVGIEAGVAGLVVLAHLGVGALLLALPSSFTVLRWACFAYLAWLAWRVLRDDGAAAHGPDPDARPMGIGAAALFQLVNPKAWMMAITGITAFSTGRDLTAGGVGTVIAIFIATGTPCMLCWALWGAAIHRLLRRPGARRAFNVAMAVIVAGTAVSMLRTP